MNDQLRRFRLLTCGDTSNAISSPGSEAGQSPLELLDGQKIAHAGRGQPPVNPIVLSESKKDLTIRGTCIPSGSASLFSASLQWSLESRLKTQLPKGGLTGFIKGWNRKVTPSGRHYCQLSASVRPISGIGSSFRLWTTASSRDWKDTFGMKAQRRDGKSRNDQLPRQAFGMMGNLSKSPEGKIASLNPAFPLWIMGFNIDVLFSMRLAMRSFRKSPPNSSRR